jgi:hypothetical protein
VGVEIAQSVYRRITSWTAGIWFPAEARDFSLRHNVQTATEANLDSYPIGTGDSFAPCNEAEAWSWPLFSI